MVLDTITNNCTYCNTPDRSVTDGKCGCSLSYYPTSTSCSPCIPNSAYNSTAKTCLCITNYAMLNGQCVLNANCPFMSYWNAALQKCICNFTGQYVIDGYCQSCQPYSVYSGSVCVCQSGYYMSNGFCIQNCTANQTWNGQVCQCKQGYYLIGGTCMLCDANSYYSNTLFTCVCNNGYFGTWSQCSQCDASCATCSGPGSNQCLTCRGSATFSNGFCRVVCIPGTYANSLNQCSSCDSSCYTCSGPGNNLCTSCAFGFTLTNAFCIANSSPPTPTPSSGISLRGYVLGNNVIYQGVAMNLMPSAILSAGCTICNNLFTVSVTSLFASITTTQ
jgi:proprotein convertase subtilisin/kexin type 5